MTIREAQKEDWESIRVLRLSYFGRMDRDAFPADDFLKWYVADENQEIKGCYAQCEWPQGRHITDFYGSKKALYVMWKFIEERAKEDKVGTLISASDPRNTPFNAMLDKAGFETVAIIKQKEIK